MVIIGDGCLEFFWRVFFIIIVVVVVVVVVVVAALLLLYNKANCSYPILSSQKCLST